MSASVMANQMQPPNLFGGGFGLNMPQTGMMPMNSTGFGAHPQILQAPMLEAPGIGGAAPMFDMSAGMLDHGSDMFPGMQPLAFDANTALQSNFVFYPEANCDPEPVKQAAPAPAPAPVQATHNNQNPTQSPTNKAAHTTTPTPETKTKTRDTQIKSSKKKKATFGCC